MRVIGAGIRIFFVLCPKTYSTLGCLFWPPCWFATGRWERPLFWNAFLTEYSKSLRWRRNGRDDVCLFCQNKSLWTSDAIWWHIFGSPLAQIMACFLTAPSLYLYQCWHTISKVQWHLRIISVMVQSLFDNINLNFIHLKFHSNLERAHGLTIYQLHRLNGRHVYAVKC